MELDFRGKKAFVTGGANGIGLAISRTLAESGALVIVLDLESEEPAKVASTIGCRGVPIDVTNRQSVDEAFSSGPPPDIVVANAGIVRPCELTATTEADWNQTIAVNLSGVFHTVRAAAERMKPRRQGSIVLTASTNSFDGEANLIAYNATKAGVLGILHTAANELGPYGIRVNAVCPGLIRTRLTNDYFGEESRIREYFRHIPLGRGGEPGEVANAVAFLASSRASYITGAALLVDGGQMASKYSTWSDLPAAFSDGAWRLA